MKFFCAGIFTETNTFSSIPTSRASFSEMRGIQASRGDTILASWVQHLAERARRDGASVEVGLCASAQPSAPMGQGDWEQMRDALVDDLRRGMPVDAVFLLLHGAMVSEGCLDCEGDILERVRACIGPDVPVLAILDPHAHLTDRMVRNADVLLFMKEYPHTDGPDCIDRSLRLARRMLENGTRPTAGIADCHIVGLWPTQNPPVRGFIDRLGSLEKEEGILSVSFVHGFPWGDTPDTGSKILVYTDGDGARACECAERLAAEVWAMRGASQPKLASVEEAVGMIAETAHGPLVLADVADNAGGGAAGDSSFILRAVLDHGLTGVAFALFYDPELVEMCHSVGTGARVSVQVGGKRSPFSGDPVAVEGMVRGVSKNAVQRAFGDSTAFMGNTAWIHAQGVDLVVSSVRTQVFHPEAFTHIGIDPSQYRALVVKSINHFQAGFASIAGRIVLVSTPGALSTDFAHLPYRVFNKPYWPQVERPTGA